MKHTRIIPPEILKRSITLLTALLLAPHAALCHYTYTFKITGAELVSAK